MGWIRDLRGEGSSGNGNRDSVDRDWLHLYPALHEYISVGTAPDGSPRRTATVTIFADGGGWKVYLNERHSSASLCATGSTIGDALSALEVLLESEHTPWRFSVLTDPTPSQKRRKRS